MVTDLEKVEYLQNALIAFATNDTYDTSVYEAYRSDIISNPVYEKLLPMILKKYRTGGHFWPFIKTKFKSYQERRQYIYDEFSSFINFLERKEANPSDTIITTTIEDLGEGYITEEWNKALQRRSTDPKGAITMARTLLETTCKFILDKKGIEYTNSIEMPDLYKLTSNCLNLAPSQHTEPIIKQILGGCTSIVIGIGSLRNKISDSHGQGINKVNPYERHATLVVNAAGTLATFLLQTLELKTNRHCIKGRATGTDQAGAKLVVLLGNI